MNINLMNYIFQTNAFRVADEENPFWYTSGKIGPYFVNAQFLYGSEEDSKKLLSSIDQELLKDDKKDIPKNIFNLTLKQYESNPIYHNVIDEIVTLIKTFIPIDAVDYISGGERRDWFFSNILAFLLKKPHITIFKDLSIISNSYNFSSSAKNPDLNGKTVLHIADLLNQASSYIRAWAPTIEKMGGNLKYSVVAVDRMQGGTEKLIELGIKPFSLVQIDEFLFEKSHENEIINEKQLEMLKGFAEAPDETMKNFLKNHPNFLENALNSSDKKVAARAKLCIDNHIYE